MEIKIRSIVGYERSAGLAVRADSAAIVRCYVKGCLEAKSQRIFEF